MTDHTVSGPTPVCLPERLRRLALLLIISTLGGAAWIVVAPRALAGGPEPLDLAPANSPTRGALVICGGGALPGAVYDRFLELAGGPRARIVFIPTASEANTRPGREPRDLGLLRAHGATTVQLLHTRSRDEANDPAFVRPLTEATGVWLSGGAQSRLAEVYVDTAVERQLKAMLDRGGVIGGTSAGAAIMTRMMITGGRSEVRTGRGFDLLPNSVVDQHFLKRNRLARLLALLSEHPGLVGFGIDEGTALVLSDDHLSVVGTSCVVACLPGRQQVLRPGDRLDPPWLSRPGEMALANSSLPASAETPARAVSAP